MSFWFSFLAFLLSFCSSFLFTSCLSFCCCEAFVAEFWPFLFAIFRVARVVCSLCLLLQVQVFFFFVCFFAFANIIFCSFCCLLFFIVRFIVVARRVTQRDVISSTSPLQAFLLAPSPPLVKPFFAVFFEKCCCCCRLRGMLERWDAICSIGVSVTVSQACLRLC